ncbi:MULTISPECIES: UDP-4-amino-4,6-dideoxy-N-acetyl-beta-L-altrosamine transaminase [Bacillus cereus group]|uniref:UDP-4-amino-4, 6-dideoxy-N-acetyl-beta-L-altrosamine transaminase n=1 Tax=Bacillus thuringiensis TaxID=1428 RepID=A0AB36V0Z9_BACTU|nr:MULTISPECIES: UDP-4-amino-4,6-dideoxy-N-acetyl-beta-L-altrosamine transaminase [Bacillus cereus group]MCP1399097.1 UDP-4-amino-4,6-dideoxy-N-acetyl-beta-L-altrosamine transaminase [Bacillus cereus]MED3056184.1 UDP-4-amino-4,6-dideoxy-N-acetyl-beta-L-altrosamine transaminase [Bacillus thuringiensis]OBW85172.1 UDP-4-amino-4,6-dideoxy-N-acetyl-beta-L-altrosamine transaminase [Bacillus cereus]PDX92072.1 UDP-4-amino-4,6-dideoxy-N-acetyl-beta-L-altrosamine transaminase [Bacillus thuringiensis]PEF
MVREILGIHGGKPVREAYLPYGQQQIDEYDIQAVVDVLKGDFLTTGPMIQQFEEAIAKYVGAKYAVSFSNGTAALHAACYAAGITEGDEVITTPMTFVASANCILYQGAKPVFADIDNETYNISPKSIEEKITNKTKAIIPVHFTGQPVELEAIQKIAKKNNLIIIEDAAHALGATYKNKKIGSIGDMTMFSFHPVKHITTGEGGVITTNNPLFYEKLIQFRTHGIEKNPQKLLENHGPWYYEMQFLGYNYRITDIQAALGLSQLSKLESFIKIRKKYVDIYSKEFSCLSEIIIPKQLPQTSSSWHLYIIRLNTKLLKCNRKEFYEALQRENIGVNVHYIPVHLQPFYQKLGYEKGICPQAENVYEEIITLPLFPKMTEADVWDVIQAVRKVLLFYSVAKN